MGVGLVLAELSLLVREIVVHFNRRSDGGVRHPRIDRPVQLLPSGQAGTGYRSDVFSLPEATR